MGGYKDAETEIFISDASSREYEVLSEIRGKVWVKSRREKGGQFAGWSDVNRSERMVR